MKEKFHFKKEMGQNFIFDSQLIEQLADASGVTKEDGVLEIGPGAGTLSCALARKCRKLICVELDRTLIDPLRQTLALYPNAEVVQGDILRQDLSELAEKLGTPCRVAANLPYNITTPVMERMLKENLPFLSLAVMVQKEVGERMMAGPGQEGYGPLSLLVAYKAYCKEALPVPAECFTPKPKVDSSFMLLTMRSEPAVQCRSEESLFRLIRCSFAMRRKTLINNLLSAYQLSRQEAENVLIDCGISATVRAEQLTLEEFARLSDVLEK